METDWRGGEGRDRCQGECKGRTQNEENWKINPGLAGECGLENRTEELGGRNKRHCIRVVFAGEGANEFLVEMKLGRAHYGIRCWRLVLEKRRQKQGKLWQTKQGVWRHLFPSLRRKLDGLMLRTAVGLWPLIATAGRDCVQLGWAVRGQQGLETLDLLVVGQERGGEPSSLTLQSRFDLNCCAPPFCSNKHKTWEISLGFLINQCHCFFPKLTPCASLRQVFDFTLSSAELNHCVYCWWCDGIWNVKLLV